MFRWWKGKVMPKTTMLEGGRSRKGNKCLFGSQTRPRRKTKLNGIETMLTRALEENNTRLQITYNKTPREESETNKIIKGEFGNGY